MSSRHDVVAEAFTPGRARIAIIGAGLCGSLAAVVLARAGHAVTLIDRHAVYPAQFRVEKIGGVQIDLLRKLSMLDAVAKASTLFRNIVNVRAGRIVDHSDNLHYGILYDELVRVVRAQLPSSVEFIVDDVVDLRTGPQTQDVKLSRGERHSVDLILLATGMRSPLAHRLGIGQRLIAEKHSISFGFTIASHPRQMCDFEALTCYGEYAGRRIDYLSLFPIGDTLRANLFTYLDHQDPWIRELRRSPCAELRHSMPGVSAYLGPFEPLNRVENWTMDLLKAENVDQDGIVLIGDAFQTSCPAAGTGVSRLLTDIDRLCNVHIPQWLGTPGMGREKIAAFYADRVKQAMDADAMRMAHFRRSLTIGRSLRWSLRREEHFMRRRVVGWMAARRRGDGKASAGRSVTSV